MLFVESGQSFGRDPVVLSSALVCDGRLEPSLLDPLDHLRGAHAHGIRQSLHRKAVAADIANAQLPSVESVQTALGLLFSRLATSSTEYFVSSSRASSTSSGCHRRLSVWP